MFPLLVASLASAASFDPELDWRTLQTEHFNITFHQGEEQLANELGTMAEDIHERLAPAMGKDPKRRTEVVLVDHTDVANGYAMRLPVNTIVIFVTAPQESSGLGLYEDWLQMIMTHEYAHILHLDTVRGLPLVLRYTLGRIVSVNDLSPLWIVEGSATWWETQMTTGGRGRSAHTDMILRMAVLEDGFPELGQLDGFMASPPSGNARYLFGQSLLDYLVRHSSEDAITRWNQSYGAWPLPYVLPARQVFGQGFRQAYKGWKAELTERYEAQAEQVSELGLATWPTLLMDEELDGSCSGPRWSPQGDKLVFACSDRRDGANIYLMDAETGESTVELEEGWGKTFAWRPDGQAFAYSSTHVVDTWNLYEDVYFHKLGSESSTRLTSGQRARDPVFSPDGADMLVVTNAVQNNNLARLRIDQSLTELTENRDHTQLSTPRYSPDGRFLALSVWQDGTRDIWIYRADGTPYRRVTADMHHDRDPSFSADGRWLFFSSDRSGIANIYAVELETERIHQVTNVLSGAFQPDVSPDFERLAYQHYSHNGYRIGLIDVNVEAWLDQGQLPRQLSYDGALDALLPGVEEPEERVAQAGGLAGFGGPVEVDAVAPGKLEVVLDQPVAGPDLEDRVEADLDPGKVDLSYPFDHPVRDYNPFPTLLPPRYMLPTLYSTTLGYMGALSTGGTDTLRRYGYAAYLTYRTDANFLGGGASFTNNRWRLVMAGGAHRYVVPYGDIYRQAPYDPGANIPVVQSTNNRYWDKRSRIWTSVAYPRKQYQAVWARYTGMYRGPKDDLGKQVYRPLLPTRGFLSSVSAGWRYAKGKAYPYSISPEDGRVLGVSAQLTTRALGSYVLDETDQRVPFDRFQVTAEAREYIPMPWSHNHVLGLRGSAGVSVGDQLRYGAFRLGGSFGESAYYQLPDEWQSLRGFPVATVSGDTYYLGTVEYRMPIWRVDRGTGTVPLFLRALHGAAFVDVGDAFDVQEGLSTLPRVGAGAELRMGTIVGWGLPVDFRVGYAVALLGSGGFGPTDLESLYLRLGTSF